MYKSFYNAQFKMYQVQERDKRDQNSVSRFGTCRREQDLFSPRYF